MNELELFATRIGSAYVWVYVSVRICVCVCCGL